MSANERGLGGVQGEVNTPLEYERALSLSEVPALCEGVLKEHFAGDTLPEYDSETVTSEELVSWGEDLLRLSEDVQVLVRQLQSFYKEIRPRCVTLPRQFSGPQLDWKKFTEASGNLQFAIQNNYENRKIDKLVEEASQYKTSQHYDVKDGAEERTRIYIKLARYQEALRLDLVALTNFFHDFTAVYGADFATKMVSH